MSIWEVEFPGIAGNYLSVIEGNELPDETAHITSTNVNWVAFSGSQDVVTSKEEAALLGINVIKWVGSAAAVPWSAIAENNNSLFNYRAVEGRTHHFWSHMTTPNPTNVKFKMQVRWRDAVWAPVGSVEETAFENATGGWQQFSLSAVAPVGTIYAQIVLWAETIDGSDFPALTVPCYADWMSAGSLANGPYRSMRYNYNMTIAARFTPSAHPPASGLNEFLCGMWNGGGAGDGYEFGITGDGAGRLVLKAFSGGNTNAIVSEASDLDALEHLMTAKIIDGRGAPNDLQIEVDYVPINVASKIDTALKQNSWRNTPTPMEFTVGVRDLGGATLPFVGRIAEAAVWMGADEQAFPAAYFNAANMGLTPGLIPNGHKWNDLYGNEWEAVGAGMTLMGSASAGGTFNGVRRNEQLGGIENIVDGAAIIRRGY